MNRDTRVECERVKTALPEFAVGGCTPRTRTSIERHIAECGSCATEFRTLRRTGELLSRMPLDPAPDLWASIRPNLPLREAARTRSAVFGWVVMHRLQSAGAAAAVTIALAAVMLTNHPTKPAVAAMGNDAQGYFNTYASMSWREPFADRAGLGMMADLPVQATSEAVH